MRLQLIALVAVLSASAIAAPSTDRLHSADCVGAISALHDVELAVTASAKSSNGTSAADSLDLAPDGHFKFPHLWPPKLLQAGRPNYRCFAGLNLFMRLMAFGPRFESFDDWLFGKRSASGRRHRPRSGGQATAPVGAVHRPCPVGGWLVHGGRACLRTLPGSCAATNLATRPIELQFHPGWTIAIREHRPIELTDHTQPGRGGKDDELPVNRVPGRYVRTPG